jgi:DNA-binding response OmpR family regulator
LDEKFTKGVKSGDSKPLCELLILDVLMKGLDGFELYNQMRKIDENILICFMSASNMFCIEFQPR